MGALLQIGELFLQSPGGIRIRQWLNISMETGMAQLEFQLWDDSELGTYTIYMMKNAGRSTKATFRVEEYGMN